MINNVSNHAIATLNPDEMLAKIATEIEKSLAYDHIGIAILDYSTKELVVQAEAGPRRNAAGRRILLGEGLRGRQARAWSGCQRSDQRQRGASGDEDSINVAASAPTRGPLLHQQELKPEPPTSPNSSGHFR